MRFRWSRLAIAALLIGAGYAIARAVAPLADALAAAISPHETPRLNLRYLVALLALTLAGFAAYGGVAAYKQHQQTLAIAQALEPADPSKAPALMIRYGCAGCHTIPGVPGADGQVGPNLKGLRARVFVGGVARNTAANLVRWIYDAPSLSPRSAMPRTGANKTEAREIAAWLYAN